jgi:hypothetical protein
MLAMQSTQEGQAVPIDLSDKIVALLSAMTDADIEALPPAKRRRFGAVCRHAAAVAERCEQSKTRQQEAGVLADLRRGVRQE